MNDQECLQWHVEALKARGWPDAEKIVRVLREHILRAKSLGLSTAQSFQVVLDSVEPYLTTKKKCCFCGQEFRLFDMIEGQRGRGERARHIWSCEPCATARGHSFEE